MPGRPRRVGALPRPCGLPQSFGRQRQLLVFVFEILRGVGRRPGGLAPLERSDHANRGRVYREYIAAAGNGSDQHFGDHLVAKAVA